MKNLPHYNEFWILYSTVFLSINFLKKFLVAASLHPPQGKYFSGFTRAYFDTIHVKRVTQEYTISVHGWGDIWATFFFTLFPFYFPLPVTIITSDNVWNSCNFWSALTFDIESSSWGDLAFWISNGYLQHELFQWPRVGLCNTLAGGCYVCLWVEQST